MGSRNKPTVGFLSLLFLLLYDTLRTFFECKTTSAAGKHSSSRVSLQSDATASTSYHESFKLMCLMLMFHQTAWGSMPTPVVILTSDLRYSSLYDPVNLKLVLQNLQNKGKSSQVAILNGMCQSCYKWLVGHTMHI